MLSMATPCNRPAPVSVSLWGSLCSRELSGSGNSEQIEFVSERCRKAL